MENCTIYSHETDFSGVMEIIKHNLPKGKFEWKDEGMQQQFTAILKGGLFSKDHVLKVNFRRRAESSYNLDKIMCPLSENLAGMVNFIQTFPAKNQDIKNQLIAKVKSCNSEFPFMAEPEITPEFRKILLEITSHLDAIVFAQPNKTFRRARTHHFIDKNLNLVLDQEGYSEVSQLDVRISSAYHDSTAETYSENQLERRKRSESQLMEHNIKINKHLPLSKDAKDVQWRTPSDLSARMHALLVTAAKGEGIGQEILDKMITGKAIHDLSDQETYIIASPTLSEQDKAHATWRYESLTTLLWAAGILPALVYPSTICNVGEAVQSILGKSRSDFDASISLRDPEEIMDQLDAIYLMDWACVDARLKGEEPGGNLHPGVVYERHYALNWLTRYQDQEWDQVQTNT